ncbi:TetR/AcrR family transcriptional regulator [Halopseudomonas pelagia]|uniref:TetR/AcrR family transcriptional regulator n=1 Tax=Halopseudomonas pelagia TaxID=553151 RepID=UPI0003AB0FFB|nr:TetR/AcrR family transcriptional regulator [Halopseudomonas pelagia]|tara:strand:- start:92462 stop:93100 length:639 start_codon:yes stop_codon:yes gene_type:complete
MGDRPLATAGPGRPVDPDKLDRILDAVLDSFAEGDMHFTIEGVARRADVSKGTIYRHFNNADALLAAVLSRLHLKMLGNLPDIEECAGGLREQLIILGTQLLDFLTSEQGVRIMRTVIAHGARQAEHGELIYRDGPQAFVIRAAACLNMEHERGHIELQDALLTAEQLIGMWKGGLVTGLWMNGRARPDEAEKRYRVESAVDLLLRGLNWTG